MAHPVNFDEIKAAVSVEDCAKWLGIKLKANRGDCPLCGHDRTFTVTPEKRLWGCHACKARGSVLDMVHLVRQTANVRDAALLLQENFLGTKPRTVSAPAEHSSPATTPSRQEDGELKPLDYLTTDHEAIEALGLSQLACQALGVGFAPKGTMRGRVVFPLRTMDGKLCGYAGLATRPDMAPLMLIPKNLDQMLAAPAEEKPQQTGDDVRAFLRVVK